MAVSREWRNGFPPHTGLDGIQNDAIDSTVFSIPSFPTNDQQVQPGPEEACPGGQLPRAEGADAQPMCAEGYVGSGCTRCAKQFARADSSILACALP